MTDRPAAIVAAEAPVRSRPSVYPEPFAARMAGRVKQPLGGPELAQVSSLDLGTFEPFTVTEARLMSSALGPDGARHACEAVLPLSP